MLPDCPTDAELAALVSGELPEDARRALEHHLETCVACRMRLDAMALGDGQWVGNARAYAKAEPAMPAPSLVKRLKSDRPSTVQITLAPPDPLLSPDQGARRLGDYEILSELGRGGMGVVFKARQLSLHRDVALKVILAGQLASEDLVRRFHIEAEAVAKLDHGNIVPIYETGEHEGRHFFSMKLIEGASLKKRHEEFQALRPDAGSNTGELKRREQKLARLMADIAHAVHHAHQRGILHRDLKPANVLVDAQGQPHLTDFGLAKVLQSDSSLTRSQAVMGTPAYMSPEQAAGKTRLIATTSDVYSLGAMLYELLTGRPPFDAEDPMVIMNRTVNEEPKPPRTLNPAVSRDLEILCLKCLEKEPTRRHRSAEAFAEELERLARGEPIHSRSVSLPERVWRWSKRKPALAGALAGLVGVFVAGFSLVTWKWQGERRQHHLADAATSRAEEQTDRAQKVVVRLEIERAEAHFHDGNSDKSLANLARLLRRQRTNDVAAARLMNALSYRNFSLPIAPLRPAGARPVPQELRRTRPQARATGRPEIETTCISFAPDGLLIVTASLDGTVRLWDSRTGQPVGEPLKHDGGVWQAQFSSDGNKLVTACEDGAARVWSVPSGQLLATTRKRPAAVRYAGFSPDGERIVTALNNGAVQTWNAKTGQPLGTPFFHQGQVYFAAFSPNGRQLLTAQTVFDGPPGFLWDLKTRATIKLPHHPREEIWNRFPSFSPSGEQVLVFEGINAFLFSTQDSGESFPRPASQLQHDDQVSAATFSPDGRFIATGSHDATVRVWPLGSAQNPPVSLPHKQAVNSVQFSADGRTLLTGSSDRAAQLWNPTSGLPIMEPLRHASPVLNAVMASNRIVTLSETEGVWLWDVPTSQPPAVNWQEERGVNISKFTADGQAVVSLSRAGLSFVNPRTGQPVRSPITPKRPGRQLPDAPKDVPQEILDFDLSSDCRFLATALEFGHVLLWEPFAKDESANDPIRQPFGEGDPDKRRTNAFVNVRFSPDDRFLLAASSDGAVRLWEIGTHQLAIPLLQHRGRVSHAEFNRDGTLIVTASWDKTARVWNAKTGEPSTPPLQHGAEVTWASFGPGGLTVVTASRDKTVCTWSAQTGERLQSLQHASALAETHPFDFSPDGQRMATVAGDSLQIWEVATGKSLLGPIRHRGLLQSVRFSRDGIKLVTAANDKTARLWGAEAGHALGDPMWHEGRVTYAEFSPDGGSIVTSSWDERVRVWPVIRSPIPVPEWLPELAEALAGQRILENDVSEVVSVAALFQLRQQLQATSAPDHYSRWARSFFADDRRRSTASFLELTAKE